MPQIHPVACKPSNEGLTGELLNIMTVVTCYLLIVLHTNFRCWEYIP